MTEIMKLNMTLQTSTESYYISVIYVEIGAGQLGNSVLVLDN